VTPPTAPPPGASTLVDEIPGIAFGWIAPTPAFMQRASHAIAVDGQVWIVDAVYDTAALARVTTMGTPAGVVQQLDRHPRDCARVAAELGVPLYVLPTQAPDGAPFEVIPVVTSRVARWHEIALWFPGVGVLSVAEAVGGAPYFCAPGAALGPHPLLRIFAPPRRLAGIGCDHLLFGHGPGVHGPDTAHQLGVAIRSARRSAPRWALGLAGIGRRSPEITGSPAT
jgi:hypothetical protein